MKGPIRELIPIGEQLVRVRVPTGREVASVRLLRAGTRGDPRYEEGGLTVSVPFILDHEVIAVDFTV
jgi:hypothetical protein